ncbi:MAG: universal stress protein [Bacteroidales bacterium]|nr:universal stress protein [Bacteroidales bacterium]
MEEQTKRKILVYTDFTSVGEKSVQWAVYFAEKFQMELMILHVINENTYTYFQKSTAEDDVKHTLEDYCATIKKDHNINCEYYVEEGCTCTIINSTAERIDAYLIVLGTHGKNDLQFLSGTSALKIIRKARIPYFVIQKNTPHPSYGSKIILPMDMAKEMKEKTGWVTYFAKHLEQLIDIVHKKNSEPQLSNNIAFCTKFFDKYELVYNRIVLNERKSINQQAVDYASNNTCKMVVITTTKDETIFHKIFGFPETKIIANEKGIPVLCVNPKKDLYVPCI